MVHLPTFTIKINQELPYMDSMGIIFKFIHLVILVCLPSNFNKNT